MNYYLLLPAAGAAAGYFLAKKSKDRWALAGLAGGFAAAYLASQYTGEGEEEPELVNEEGYALETGGGGGDAAATAAGGASAGGMTTVMPDSLPSATQWGTPQGSSAQSAAPLTKTGTAPGMVTKTAPGMAPISPAVPGGFRSTVPPAKRVKRAVGGAKTKRPKPAARKATAKTSSLLAKLFGGNA